MSRKPFHAADEKLTLVPSVIQGETTQTDVARRLQLSQTTIANRRKQFLEAGHEGLARGDNVNTEATRRDDQHESIGRPG